MVVEPGHDEFVELLVRACARESSQAPGGASLLGRSGVTAAAEKGTCSGNRSSGIGHSAARPDGERARPGTPVDVIPVREISAATEYICGIPRHATVTSAEHWPGNRFGPVTRSVLSQFPQSKGDRGLLRFSPKSMAEPWDRCRTGHFESRQCSFAQNHDPAWVAMAAALAWLVADEPPGPKTDLDARMASARRAAMVVEPYAVAAPQRSRSCRW